MESHLSPQQKFWIASVVTAGMQLFAHAAYRLFVWFFETRAKRDDRYLRRIDRCAEMIRGQVLCVLFAGGWAWSLGAAAVPIYLLMAWQLFLIVRFKPYVVLEPGGEDIVHFDRAERILAVLVAQIVYCSALFVIREDF